MSRHDPPKLEAANLEATNVIGITSLLEPAEDPRGRGSGGGGGEGRWSSVQEGVEADRRGVRAYDREIRDIEKSLGGFSLGPSPQEPSDTGSVSSLRSSRSSRSRSRGVALGSGYSDYCNDLVRLRLRLRRRRTEAPAPTPDKSIGSDGSSRSAGTRQPRSSRSRGRRRPPRHGGEQVRSERKRAMMEDLRKETRTSAGIEREARARHQELQAEQNPGSADARGEGIDTSAVGSPTIDSEMADIDSRAEHPSR